VNLEARVRQALEDAVKKAGGATVAAYRTGVTEQSIRNWLHLGRLDRVPAAEALRFARATGVPLEKLIVDATPRRG
jgi:DNA-binding transcriptional regulator YdaS (Cro superfamily)